MGPVSAPRVDTLRQPQLVMAAENLSEVVTAAAAPPRSEATRLP